MGDELKQRNWLGYAGFIAVTSLAACDSSSPPVSTHGSDDVAAGENHVVAAQKLGLPPNGPDVLYLPQPHPPQLQNRDNRFRAAPVMISGAERYIDGEYQYTDFIYDDAAATYPDGGDPTSPLWARYGGNAADLFEFRISMRNPSNLAVRFTMNTLMVPDSTISALAFDSDNDPNTGNSTLPRDPGMPFPGTDQVLTTWGTGAEWSTWNGTSWVTVPLEVDVDTESNQTTVTVPKSVANPTGKWRTTLATGLYNTDSGGWLASDSATRGIGLPLLGNAGSTISIINLGFRFDEVTTPSNGAPYNRQSTALSANAPTQFANFIDFDLLRGGGTRDNIPTSGMLYRIFPSRMEAVLTGTSSDPSANSLMLGEGFDRTSQLSSFLSPLQPYALYVSPDYQPGHAAPLSFALHGLENYYYWLNGDQNRLAKQLGDDRKGIVLSAGGRGNHGWYVGYQEYDLFEAWADVARHYTLDPLRTIASGYSMGAHGTYRLALLSPHLFAAAAPYAVPMCNGIWLILQCTTTESTVLARWTESARNIPIFHQVDTLSETTFSPGQLEFVLGILPLNSGTKSLESLGYRYKLWALVVDHILIGDNHPEITEFANEHQLDPNPFHVTYARMPSSDQADIGLVHNRAYWLSSIEVRDASHPLAKGVIDVLSLGFGKSDPGSSQSFNVGIAASSFPYVETQRIWAEAGDVPVENRLLIKATNIGSVTIDPAAARVNCDAKLDVESDGPISIKLLGCPR